MFKRRTAPPPLQTIDLAALDAVNGGRTIPKKGTDPQLLQSIQQLVETIGAVGQSINAAKQGESAQMMQMMQQMMQRKG